MTISTLDLDSPVGFGRASIERPRGRRGSLILGHGAGGRSWTAEVRAMSAAATDAGWAVALVEQPWRVAGRRVAPSAQVLDRAWVPMVESLLGGQGRIPRPLVLGGRSAGARVACRTATALDASGVLAVSFPLHPPGRRGTSRAGELVLPLGTGRALHVIQGAADPFGTPGEVVAQLPDPAYLTAVPGTHSLDGAAVQVAAAALAWLESWPDGAGWECRRAEPTLIPSAPVNGERLPCSSSTQRRPPRSG